MHECAERPTPSSGVPVWLDGREWRLRYPMAAMEAIEKRFGVDMMAGEQLKTTGGLKDVIWIIALGLRHEDPGPPAWWEKALAAVGLRALPVRPVEEWLAEAIDMQNLATVTEAMEEAMGGADEVAELTMEMRDEGEEEAEEPPKE